MLELHARDRAMEFLQGLHDHFVNIRNQILLIEPTPPTEKMFNFVEQEEVQQFINNSSLPSIDSAASQVIYYASQSSRSTLQK